MRLRRSDTRRSDTSTKSQRRRAALIAFLDRLAELVAGHVLELGSGPGGDATYLEGHGLRVTRTDAALAFVAMMRTAGHEAR
jgi:hypothetical protein